MAPTKIFQPTDLRRDRNFIDFAREHGRALLRDADDGAAFVLVSEDELTCIERSAHRARRLGEAAQALVTVAALRSVPDAWAWLEAFDPDDQQTFGREAIDALRIDMSDSHSDELSPVLDAWRESAAAIRDGERFASLTVTDEATEDVLSEEVLYEDAPSG